MTSNSAKEFLLRKAVIADADALRDCMIAAYSMYSKKLQGISLPPLNVDYATEIANYPTWVAEKEAGIVGGLIMTFENDTASVANVAVHPDAQGCGLGRMLLDFAEQQAINKGIATMRLATHARLTENVALYQHLGWEVVEQDAVRVSMEKQVL